MSPPFDKRTFRIIYGFIAARMLIDGAIASAISIHTRSLITGGGFWILCWAFYLLLFFGIRSGTFHGRYGRKVHHWREPGAWWFVFGFIVLAHFTITVLFAYLVIEWPRIFT